MPVQLFFVPSACVSCPNPGTSLHHRQCRLHPRAPSPYCEAESADELGRRLVQISRYRWKRHAAEDLENDPVDPLAGIGMLRITCGPSAPPAGSTGHHPLAQRWVEKPHRGAPGTIRARLHFRHGIRSGPEIRPKHEQATWPGSGGPELQRRHVPLIAGACRSPLGRALHVAGRCVSIPPTRRLLTRVLTVGTEIPCLFSACRVTVPWPARAPRAGDRASPSA
jgi:hypothetical protein